MFKRNKISFHFVIVTILLLFTSISCAEKIWCDQCENEILPGKSYLTSNGKIYCDEECYEKSLPVCELCGKPVKHGFIQKGNKYCSKECLTASWDACSNCGKKVRSGIHYGSKKGVFYCLECSKKPICFACGLPGNCSKLKDCRNLCPDCQSRSITSIRDAKKHIREVRKIMKKELGIYTGHYIKYEIVDTDYLKNKSSNTEMELGLYYHENRIRTETVSKNLYGFEYGKKTNITETDSFYIYLLSDLPKEKFIEITAHELAHDWMEEFYPNIIDVKIIEGWAEYSASLINTFYGNEILNKRMKENTSPVYGDGYRYIESYVKQHGIEKLYKLFEELNANSIKSKKN